MLRQILARDPDFHIRLEGLSEESCRQLAARLGASAEAFPGLYPVSGGNPLVLRELLLHGASSPQLSELYQARLARLGANELAALQAAAVLGRAFAHGPWLATAAAPFSVREILESGLILEDEQGYRFEHDLVQAYIFTNLSPEEKQRLHMQAALAHRQHHSPDEVTAWHFKSAGDYPQAAFHYHRAAQRALGLDDISKTRSLAERAGALLDHLPEADALPIRALRLRVLQLENWSSEYEREAKRIAQQAEQLGDIETLVRVLLVQLGYFIVQGRIDEFVETADRVIELAADSGDIVLEIQALVHVANKLDDEIRDQDRIRELTLQAIHLAERIPERPALLFRALYPLAISSLRGRDLAAAGETIDRAGALLEDNPELSTLEPELVFLRAVHAQLRGDWEEARRRQHRLVQIHRANNHFAGLQSALFNASHIAQFIGQFEEALVFAEELVAYVRENRADPDEYILGTYQAYLTECYAMTGDNVRAEEAAAPLMKWLLAQESPGRAGISAWNSIGIMRFYQGKLDEAHYAYSRALALVQTEGIVTASPYLCHAETAQLLGRHEQAKASFAEATKRINLELRTGNVTYYHYVDFLMTGEIRKLELARENLFETVNFLRDPDLRRDYYRRLPLHRDLERAWTKHARMGEATLAAIGAPLGKPMTENDRVPIRWTLAVPGLDDVFRQAHGKTALRRQRLKRMAQEAFVQGAAPTHVDLAEALGVSVRTIERDQAALDAVGEGLRTRGR